MAESEQLTILESIERSAEFELEGVEKHTEALTPDAAILCGNCGTKMKRMGPSKSSKETMTINGKSRTFTVGEWTYSCRACQKGSVEAHLNPLVKLFDDSDEVESIRRGKMEDSSTDRVKFSTGSGSGHAIVDGDSLRTIEVDDEEYVVGEEGYVERKKITS